MLPGAAHAHNLKGMPISAAGRYPRGLRRSARRIPHRYGPHRDGFSDHLCAEGADEKVMIQSPPRRSTFVSLAATTSEAPPRIAKVAAALTSPPGGVIDGGEIVLLAIKPSMWRPFFDSAPWVVTGLLLAGVLTWLGRPIPGLSLTATAQAILLVALVRVGLAIILWIPTWYVLTNRRLIDIQGVRSPRISSCLLLDVRNTYIQASPVEKLTRLGSIVFVVDHTDVVTYLWQSIAEPDVVHTKIRRAIENAIDQQ